MMNPLIAQEMRRIGEAMPIPFEVVFADGDRFASGEGPPQFALHFRRRAAALRTAAFGHIGLLDSWFDGDLDIVGDLRAVFRAGMQGGYGRPYEHCMPFDVTRAFDEAGGITHPRIWSAERDQEMWKSLEG